MYYNDYCAPFCEIINYQVLENLLVAPWLPIHSRYHGSEPITDNQCIAMDGKHGWKSTINGGLNWKINYI